MEVLVVVDRYVRNVEWNEVLMKSGKSVLYGY